MKENYNEVQCIPCKTGVSLKTGYNSKGYSSLTSLHTSMDAQRINSMIPLKKPDGSLRQCLNSKDQRIIQRNHWYRRKIDDILTNLAKTTVVSQDAL